VWELISSLKTNKQLYMNILTNDKDTLAGLSKPESIKQMPIHKLLYVLQIVKYLVSLILRGDKEDSTDEVTLYFEKPIAVTGNNEDFPGMEELGNQGQGQGQGGNDKGSADKGGAENGKVAPSSGDAGTVGGEEGKEPQERG
jgi:hypothetical protein